MNGTEKDRAGNVAGRDIGLQGLYYGDVETELWFSRHSYILRLSSIFFSKSIFRCLLLLLSGLGRFLSLLAFLFFVFLYYIMRGSFGLFALCFFGTRIILLHGEVHGDVR